MVHFLMSLYKFMHTLDGLFAEHALNPLTHRLGTYLLFILFGLKFM